MSFVSPAARQWGVAKVNKATRELFADKSIILSPSDPNLPIWLLQQLLSDVRQRFGSKDTKAYAKLMEARAAAGDLQGIRFLCNEGLAWTEKMCSKASAGGHLDVLCWMRLQSPPCPWGSAAACAIAASGGGHLPTLKYILQEHYLCPWDVSVCAEVAAQHGHLAVLQWLSTCSPNSYLPLLDAGVCAEAAAAGHLEVLVWLRSQQPPVPWDPRTCILAAAAAGHVHVLNFLQDTAPADCWDDQVATVAARMSRLPVLRWLRGMRPTPCAWSERTCAEAAAAGRLDVLQYLRDQQSGSVCPWDERTTTGAAKAGHLDVLMWTQQAQPPCQLNLAACLEAAKYRHPDILQWLLHEVV
eukprot:gene10754-10910_t